MISPISPVCLDFRQNRRFWSLEIADFRRLAIYRQAQIHIARRMSKIADLATYRQKWQHCLEMIEYNLIYYYLFVVVNFFGRPTSTELR